MKTKQTTVESSQIFVFRTNIATQEKVTYVCNHLLIWKEINEATIDLEDQENILRVECHPRFSVSKVKDIVFGLGFECSELK